MGLNRCEMAIFHTYDPKWLTITKKVKYPYLYSVLTHLSVWAAFILRVNLKWFLLPIAWPLWVELPSCIVNLPQYFISKFHGCVHGHRLAFEESQPSRDMYQSHTDVPVLPCLCSALKQTTTSPNVPNVSKLVIAVTLRFCAESLIEKGNERWCYLM